MQTTETLLRSWTIMFVLLNPFLMMVYLLDLIEDLDGKTFRSVLTRAAAISSVVFVAFAWTGDFVFARVLNVRFASFLLFGGLVFLVIGVRSMFEGRAALAGMRGKPQHVAGSIAMPFMIGPGTVSASVLTGSRCSMLCSALAIVGAVVASSVCLMGMKRVLDAVRRSHTQLVERYVDVIGRISALLIGTIAVEMLLQGYELWREAP